MKAPLPWRRFAGLAYIALYVALLVWGFWVDVSRSQQVIGQALAVAVIVVATYAVFSDRGHEGHLRRIEPADLSDPSQQWALFFKCVTAFLAFVISQDVELTLWATLTISVPLTILAYGGGATVVRAVRRRRQVPSAQEIDSAPDGPQ